MPAASALAHAPKVLVADDSVAARRTMTLLLTSLGCSGVLVADGQAALACLEKREFDLLLLDVSMPEIDGLQVLARIRQAEHGNAGRQRIIMVTGHAEPGDRSRLLEAGADGYISKPIASGEFAAEVRRVLQLG